MIAWLEDVDGALRLMGGAPASPGPLAVGDIAQRSFTFYPLVGAILLNLPDAGGNPGAVSYRLSQSGLEVLKDDGGQDLPLPRSQAAGTYNESMLDVGGSNGTGLNTSETGADGSSLLVNSSRGLFAVPAQAGTPAGKVCAPNSCTYMWHSLNGFYTFDRSNNSGSLDNSGWFFLKVDPVGSGIFSGWPDRTSYQIPGGPNFFKPLLPRDNTQMAWVMGTGSGPFSLGFSRSDDFFNTYTAVDGLDAKVGVSFFNWLAEGAAGSTLGGYSAGFIQTAQTQTFFDDPLHGLIFDSTHLYGVTAPAWGTPSAVVELDGASAPFHYASNGSVSLTGLTFDRKHAWFQAQNGAVVSWPTGGASAVAMGPGPALLPSGNAHWTIAGAGDELSSTTALLVLADGTVLAQSWDGGATTTLNAAGEEADTTSRRFGITPDGVAWWAGADGHLRVRPLAGAQTLDFGLIDSPLEIVALGGGAFLFVQQSALHFASVAAPTPVAVGAADGSPTKLAVNDDWTFAVVADADFATFLITAQGATPLAGAAGSLSTDPITGTVSVKGPGGALWLGSLRAGAPAPVQVEATSVSTVSHAGGHSVPQITGWLVLTPEFTQAAGAAFRWAPVYVKDGVDQPGIYVWDVVYGLGE